MSPIPMGVTPGKRDAVRIDVARMVVERAISNTSPLDLQRLETDVVLVDVHTDLEIARLHLTNAAAALRRIAEALRRGAS